MAVSTPFVRSYFRQVWIDAQANGKTLLEQLQALNSSALAVVSSGKVLNYSGGNGRRVEFHVPGSTTKDPAEGVTGTDIVEMIDKIMVLYDAGTALGTYNTDQDLYTYILGQLKPVRKTRSDFRLLRSSKLDLFPIFPFYR